MAWKKKSSFWGGGEVRVIHIGTTLIMERFVIIPRYMYMSGGAGHPV